MSQKAAQKLGSTQKFTEVEHIEEDIVLLAGGNACLILEVQATNFELLSLAEQNAKIAAYGSLLNSLSFPIQIVIRNKHVDISLYLKLIDAEIQKLQVIVPTLTSNNTANVDKKLAYIRHYRIFIEELIKINTVLNKAFYIVISYSFLEGGITNIGVKKTELLAQAKTALHTKAESLLTQMGRIGLKTRILEEDALIRLFYDIFNQEQGIGNQINALTASVVRGAK